MPDGEGMRDGGAGGFFVESAPVDGLDRETRLPGVGISEYELAVDSLTFSVTSHVFCGMCDSKLFLWTSLLQMALIYSSEDDDPANSFGKLLCELLTYSDKILDKSHSDLTN